MKLLITTYTHEQRYINNVIAFDFDGETGLVRYSTSDKPLQTDTMNYVKDIKVGDD